jgi:hypothetical protein
MPPSRSWSFGFRFSLRSFAFRVCMCLCVRVCVRVLLQMRLWVCLSHVYTYRCAVRFSFSAAAAPAHTLRALLLASSPLLVLKHLPVTHRWASDGLVGPSSHSWSLCVDTLALFAGDRRARALQGIASSTTKLVRRPVLPPTLHSCRSLSKSFGPSPSPSPLALCREVFIVGVCPISVPFGVALLLFAALNACCHARARGCILCTLDIPYVCFAPRDVA